MLYDYYEVVSPIISLTTGLFIGVTASIIVVASILSAARANPVVGVRDD